MLDVLEVQHVPKRGVGSAIPLGSLLNNRAKRLWLRALSNPARIFLPRHTALFQQHLKACYNSGCVCMFACVHVQVRGVLQDNTQGTSRALTFSWEKPRSRVSEPGAGADPAPFPLWQDFLGRLRARG